MSALTGHMALGRHHSLSGLWTCDFIIQWPMWSPLEEMLPGQWILFHFSICSSALHLCVSVWFSFTALLILLLMRTQQAPFRELYCLPCPALPEPVAVAVFLTFGPTHCTLLPSSPYFSLLLELELCIFFQSIKIHISSYALVCIYFSNLPP